MNFLTGYKIVFFLSGQERNSLVQLGMITHKRLPTNHLLAATLRPKWGLGLDVLFSTGCWHIDRLIPCFKFTYYLPVMIRIRDLTWTNYSWSKYGHDLKHKLYFMTYLLFPQCLQHWDKVCLCIFVWWRYLCHEDLRYLKKKKKKSLLLNASSSKGCLGLPCFASNASVHTFLMLQIFYILDIGMVKNTCIYYVSTFIILAIPAAMVVLEIYAQVIKLSV